MNNDDIYTAWKPLRNKLSKMGTQDSLEAIWWYSWHNLFIPSSLSNVPLPNEMKVGSWINNKRKNPILLWELCQLAEEVIICGKEYVISSDESLKNEKNFISALNKLKRLNEASSKLTLSRASIWDELYRVGHQQFKYQGHAVDDVAMTRFYNIWGSQDVGKAVKTKFGLELHQICTILFVFLASYQHKATISLNDLQDLCDETGITVDDIKRIVQTIVVPFSTIKERLENDHVSKLNEKYAYQYSQITAFPIIDFSHEKEKLLCPIPQNLQLRLQNGLYYDLSEDESFRSALGDSFQSYVGDVIKTTLTGSAQIYEEEEDDNVGKCDWVIDQNDSTMLVECKTKRPKLEAYTEIFNLSPRDDELGKLADAVVQSYKAYFNYKDGKYANPRFRFTNKPTCICVVTMESWHIFDKTDAKLNELVLQKMIDKGLNPSIIQKVPYVAMSINDFEEFTYYLTKYDGYNLIYKHRSEHNGYIIGSIKDFIDNEEFISRYKYVFLGQFPQCFTPELSKIIHFIRHQKKSTEVDCGNMSL